MFRQACFKPQRSENFARTDIELGNGIWVLVDCVKLLFHTVHDELLLLLKPLKAPCLGMHLVCVGHQ